LCEREDIQGNGDQYEFPDGADISPEEDVGVLDRCILYLRQVGAAKELIQKLERQGDAALNFLLFGRRIKPFLRFPYILDVQILLSSDQSFFICFLYLILVPLLTED